ncbi:helix-turn-helix domain-containing protein [Paraclostridium sordellii]
MIKMYNQGTWKISEIQQATNCSRNTVYKYINEGKKEGKVK